MSTDFLHYYEDSLRLLREEGAAFARHYPNIAAGLGLTGQACADPFVERLLEGTAFLHAQVQQTIDAGYPRLLQQLSSRLCPLLGQPFPALTLGRILSLPAGGSIASGSRVQTTAVLPSGTERRRRCTFSTFWAGSASPFVITDCSYSTQIQDELSAATAATGTGIQAQSVLCLQIERRGGSAAPAGRSAPAQASHKSQDFLIQGGDLSASAPVHSGSRPFVPGADCELYVNLPEADASALQALLCTGLLGVYYRDGSGLHELAGISADLSVCCKDNVLSAPSVASLLSLYVHYRPLLHFVTVHGLQQALQNFPAGHGQLLFVFSKDAALQLKVQDNSVQTDILPLINLFYKRSSRSALTLRRQYLIEAERTAPLDYEILQVQRIEFFSAANTLSGQALPLYPQSTGAETEAIAARPLFFDTERKPRLQGTFAARSSYTKSECYVSFSGEAYASLAATATEFAADLQVCNADLPLFVPQGAVFSSPDSELSLQQVTPVCGLSGSALLQAGRDEYALLSCVLLNVNSLLQQSGEQTVHSLRALLRLFAADSAQGKALAASVVSCSRQTQTFRLIRRGVVLFEQGYSVVLTLDESKLSGAGAFMLSRMLCQVLQCAGAVNLLLQISCCNTEGETLCRLNPAL